MKSQIAFIFFVMISMAACTQHRTQLQPDGNIVPDPATYTKVQWMDSIKDFGTINMGDSVRITFICKNVGDKPLMLTQVKPGCGCTLADYTHEAILPGGEGFVTGIFNSNRAHPGEVRKSIFVTTNTPDGINHTLTFTGKIVQPGE
ncbi:MAG: DUF1573 domain-containing protein [Chitinophagia bacterium]|jgi:hypothetical protein